MALKQCTNCRGNLADFVTVCPYCSVPQPVPQVGGALQGWDPTPQNSNKAIASLVCGVLFMCAPASIAAIILGHLALADIKRTAGRMAGHGMAIAGLVLGYVGVGLTAIYIIFMVFAFRTTMGGKIPANETAAVTTMRTYDQALKKYAEKCPQQGFPATLARLGPGYGDCKGANLLDMRLATNAPVRQGYVFQYTAGVNGAERVATFALVARPLTPGFSGNRFFYLDESGVIRQAPSQIVGPNSEPVDGQSLQNDADEPDDQDKTDQPKTQPDKQPQ